MKRAKPCQFDPLLALSYHDLSQRAPTPAGQPEAETGNPPAVRRGRRFRRVRPQQRSPQAQALAWGRPREHPAGRARRGHGLRGRAARPF